VDAGPAVGVADGFGFGRATGRADGADVATGAAAETDAVAIAAVELAPGSSNAGGASVGTGGSTTGVGGGGATVAGAATVEAAAAGWELPRERATTRTAARTPSPRDADKAMTHTARTGVLGGT
jgi:hypothetical protein